MSPPLEPRPGSDDAVDRRIRSILRVAAEERVGVEIGELHRLLGRPGPGSIDSFDAWLRDHPEEVVVVDGKVYPRDAGPDRGTADVRSLRARAYLRLAEEALDGPLGRLRPLAEVIAVSGSVAYGTPEEGDDCDFFVVTQDGLVWSFLPVALLLARRWKALRPDAPPLCFNYVVARSEAARLFAASRGFHFAREAVSAVALHGAESYRELIERSPGIRAELPPILESPCSAATARTPRGRGLVFRLLSGALFPWAAAYVQAASLVRNRRLLRLGRVDDMFRTTSVWGGYELKSRKYERLSRLYADEPTADRGGPGQA